VANLKTSAHLASVSVGLPVLSRFSCQHNTRVKTYVLPSTSGLLAADSRSLWLLPMRLNMAGLDDQWSGLAADLTTFEPFRESQR